MGRNISRGNTGLSDVVPMPISVLLPGGSTLEVIPANSPVPCTRAVELTGLPSWSAPVPVLLFESLDSTSTDREVIGTIQVGEREIRICAVRARGERIRDAVERAYAEKYATKASQKYVRGFRTPRRREATIEFVPRQSG